MPSATPLIAGLERPKRLVRLGAIDIGSNSIHMVIAQTDTDQALTTLWRVKEPLGLGRISFPSKRLSKKAIDVAIATLRRMKETAIQRQCESLRAVATSAVREAENGGELIERCRRELKLSVRIVSAREEARLIYLGVRHSVDLKSSSLIVDIGGGSVEFIVGDGKRATLLESRKLGASRMTAQFIRSDPAGADEVEKLRQHYQREIEPLAKRIAELKPAKWIGTSGTLENLAAMCGSVPDPNSPISAVIDRSAFEKVLSSLIASNASDREKITGLDGQRRDQILAGALLVEAMFHHFDFGKIEICRTALREGILSDYIETHLPALAIRGKVPDPRRRSVLDLARRCDWHRTHSEQVATLTLQLFDQLRSLHGLGPAARELIEYSAMLHDIGWHISRKKHHKHSMYLIQHGELKGFSKDEIAIMANIARYHRKSLPAPSHPPFAILKHPSQRVVLVGSALLRIADGLDRSHAAAIKGLRCSIDEKTVRCALRARLDAQLELWAARTKADLFEKVFKRGIEWSVTRE